MKKNFSLFEELHIEWVKIKTNNHLFSYEIDGVVRSYTPDFFLPHFNVYLEVKGYWWGNDRQKMDLIINKYPNIRFIIIEKPEFKKILEGELVW